MTMIAALAVCTSLGAQSIWESYKTRANSEHEEFLRRAWKEHRAAPPVKDPLEESRNFTEDDEMPDLKEQTSCCSFAFFGMNPGIGKPQGLDIHLDGISEKAVADAWADLDSNPAFTSLLVSAESAMERLSLSGWGKVQLLDSLSRSMFPDRMNERQLLLSHLLSSSGCPVRLGRQDGNLICLVGVRDMIYGRSYYSKDGVRFYPLREDSRGSMHISEDPAPGNSPLSLALDRTPVIHGGGTGTRHVKADGGIEYDFSIDRNLLSFYDAYPHTEARIKAEAPVSHALRESLYPILKEKAAGKSEFEAVSIIQNYVGSASSYMTDEKYWGREKWNFPEESCAYPYGDCDDHAILFARLTRDVLGLDVVLVDIETGSGPHMAAAIRFNEPVDGAYVTHDGQKYIYCESVSAGFRPGKLSWKDCKVTKIQPVR